MVLFLGGREVGDVNNSNSTNLEGVQNELMVTWEILRRC